MGLQGSELPIESPVLHIDILAVGAGLLFHGGCDFDILERFIETLFPAFIAQQRLGIRAYRRLPTGQVDAIPVHPELAGGIAVGLARQEGIPSNFGVKTLLLPLTG